ncbi:MAG TPA: haloacid dehalogenase type II [Gammaproteobacteria bacterium]|nr:haloacid dehalogenase type II [Gammaproteobacteria bacterium]|tara:strand:+ start:3446 stop:4177 length:732 start_codon:yes stop_codon:yes gene_type:complete
MPPPRGFLFDVFGTVCDWHTALAGAATQLLQDYGSIATKPVSASDFARAWRQRYAQETQRRGSEALAWISLTEIISEALKELAQAHLMQPIDDAEIAKRIGCWRRMQPWPDSVTGLLQIKNLGPIATCSNGNFADMQALATFANLPWNQILGAEVAHFYKPHRETYLQSVAKLDLLPEEVVMVASHQADLARATSLGLQTAFVIRPLEFGSPGMGEETEVTGKHTFVANDFIDLAKQLAAAQR